jgi:hypothetical protein
MKVKEEESAKNLLLISYSSLSLNPKMKEGKEREKYTE